MTEPRFTTEYFAPSVRPVDEPPPVDTLDAFGVAADGNAQAPNGSSTEKPPKFRCIPIDDVQLATEPAWCIHRILPARGLACVVGSPKSGKSFITSDMLFAVSRGVEYAGRTTVQGPVIYLTGEGVTGFKRRLVALRRHHGVEGKGVPFHMVENVPDLGSEQTDLAVLLADLDAFLRAANLPNPRAIALDTLARCMGSGDESTARDMGRFVTRCGIIERHYGCLVCVVHHFGKDKDRGGRGSNSLDGAADVTIQVEKFAGWNRARVFEMKDGVEGQEWRFRLVPYDLESATFSPCCARLENRTCIVEILSEPSAAQPRATKQPRAPTGVAGDLHKIIQRAVDEAGDASLAGPKAPKAARAVSRDMLKKYCVTADWQQDRERNGFRAVLSRTLSTLRASDLIDFDANAVWTTQP